MRRTLLRGTLLSPIMVALLSAQQSVYMDPYFASLTQGVEVAGRASDLALQKEAVDEQSRQHLPAEAVAERALDSYRELHSNEATWRQNEDLKEALRACHESHPDCAQLAGMMKIVSKALKPDWTQLTLAEYVECLYSVAKNATFAQHARDVALLQK